MRQNAGSIVQKYLGRSKNRSSVNNGGPSHGVDTKTTLWCGLEKDGRDSHVVDRLQQQLRQMHLLRKARWKIGRNPEDCDPTLRPLATSLHTMHSLVSKNAIAEITGPLNDKAMLRCLAKFTTREIGTNVLRHLKAHWQTYGPRITRFRASIVHSLTNPAYYCPVVEWIENDTVEVVALFNIENHDCYSWLAHYAQKANCDPGNESREETWEDTWVEWRIENIDRLRTLFEAGRNLGGVLGWSTKDIVRLYCRVEPREKESDEEIRRCRQLVADHISEIQKMSYQFNDAIPLLDGFCD